MRVEFTNMNFKGTTLKVKFSENKHVSHLMKTLMDANSVHSPYRSGKAVYRLGPECSVEIDDPVKELLEYLKSLGIKFSIDKD